MSEPYSNIREILGDLIGAKVVDITQHDEEEWQEGSEAYVMLLFDNGNWLKCFIGDHGLQHNCGPDEEENDRT